MIHVALCLLFWLLRLVWFYFFHTILAFLSVPLIVLTRLYVVSVLRHSVLCHSFSGPAPLELSGVLDPQMPELLISSLSQVTVATTGITDENNLERSFFSGTEQP